MVVKERVCKRIVDTKLKHLCLDLTLGRCCGGGVNGMGCGGYVGGKSAQEHYHEGLFGTPNVTKWKRGEPAEVYWNSGAKHRGGYAYRLCKVNNGKYWHVTEECFQEGHLKFYGSIGKLRFFEKTVNQSSYC